MTERRAPDVQQRRTLADLHITKTPVDFDDDDTGDVLRVWVVKLGPNEMHSVEQRAGAEKAKILMDKEDRGSDLYLAHLAELMVLPDPNQLIPFVVVDKVQERKVSIQAELANSEKWGEELYWNLVSAWKGDRTTGQEGLETIWASYLEEPEADADYPDLPERWHEAQRIYAKLKEFQTEVDTLLEAEIPELEATWKIEPDEHGEFDPDAVRALRHKAVVTFIDQRADDVYWTEFARQRAFYSVRLRYTEPDEDGNEVPGPEIHQRYFQSMDDYERCQESVKDRVRNAYDSMTVGALEGKGWRATTPSSSPSDSPAPVEGSSTSGLEVSPA